MIKKNVPWRILVEHLLSYGNEVSYTKKGGPRARSRAEARLLRQPSTLAPSAHPRRAFIIVWKRSFRTIRKRKRTPAAGHSFPPCS